VISLVAIVWCATSRAAESPAGSTGTTPWGGLGGATGGFRVTPTRVVLEEKLKSAELTIINTGATTTTFRISLARMRMAEDGGICEVTDALPGEAFADSLIRFSPRQVELEPGASQTVRIQVRKPVALGPGEYRSHLVFRALPATPDPGVLDARPPSPAVRIALQPVYGVAVPVIVRHGECHAQVKLSDLTLVAATKNVSPRLVLTLARTGNRSAYGDITVTQILPGGSARVVGRVRGLAVYVPNPIRLVAVPLDLGPAAGLTTGSLRVTFEESAEDPEVMAEAELALP
jgi:hypothetical protein